MIHFSVDPSPLLMSVSGMVDPILVSCQTALALLSFVSIGQGTASAIVERREFVVQSEEDWKKLWTRHAPNGAPLPAVDFTSELVVGVFAGQQASAGYQIEIVRIERESSGLIVVYRIESPAKDAMVAQVLTQPFHFVRLRKLGLPVQFRKV